MKLHSLRSAALLIGLLLFGCATEPTQPGPDAAETVAAVDTSGIDVFLEEPGIEFERIGDVGMTARAEHPAEVLERILARAAELGADAVIVHSVRNQGRVGRGTDSFGTGGRGGYLVFQVQATAISYVD